MLAFWGRQQMAREQLSMLRLYGRAVQAQCYIRVTCYQGNRG